MVERTTIAEELEFIEKMRIQSPDDKGLLRLKPTTTDRDVMHGRKDDKDKARMDLIPAEAMFALADILGYGAKKYEEHNWAKGMQWGRVYGACLRHLFSWWAGRGPTTKSFLFGETDEETGRSHLWHAYACITFLIAYEERGSGTDDRYTQPKEN